MLRTILAIAFVILGEKTFGQFNDSTNYFLSYAASGMVNKVNDGTSHVVNNTVRFNVYFKRISLNITNGWIYGKQLDKLSNNDFFSIADLNLFKDERHLYY